VDHHHVVQQHVAGLELHLHSAGRIPAVLVAHSADVALLRLRPGQHPERAVTGAGGVQVDVDVDDAMAARVDRVLVPRDRRPVTLVLEDERLVGRHEVPPAQRLGDAEDLRRAEQLQRRRLALVVEVVHPVHDPPAGTLGEGVVVQHRISGGPGPPVRDPCRGSLLEALEQVAGHPCPQHEVAVRVEEADLLVAEVVPVDAAGRLGRGGRESHASS